MKNKVKELVDLMLQDNLSDAGKRKLAGIIKNYDFEKYVVLEQENEVLKAKIFTYEEIIKKSNFAPFVISKLEESDES